MIGAGSWGTALAILLAKKGFPVTLWVRRAAFCEKIIAAGENVDYLPGVALPDLVQPTSDLKQAVRNKELILMSVPSHAVAEMSFRIDALIDGNPIIVNTAKGLVEGSLRRLSQVICDNLPLNQSHCHVAVLSGPNHAEEVSRLTPTATVVAAEEKAVAEQVQDILMTPYFRVYTNPDVTGVELGGALKNIIAIAYGACEGLGYGDNTKAALITRGLVEITRLGRAMGARSATFSGLTGVGDLFVTCTSKHSRNRYVGLMLGQGKKLDEITASMQMVAEGVKTAKAAYLLARHYGVKMPITAEVCSILFEGRKPEEAVQNLMRRDKTFEIEDMAFE